MKKILLVLGLLVLVSAAPVKAYDYGGQPELDNSNKGLPVCAEAKPKAPILYEPNNPAIQKAKNPGEVRLQWTKVPQASSYNIYYGLSPRNYIYTAADIGNTDNYTVRFLGNRTYYFAVQSKGGCAAGPLSNEWAARPVGAGKYIANNTPVVAPKAVVPAKTTVTPTAAPVQAPAAPTAPAAKPKAVTPAPAAPSQGFFQSVGSFFGRMFGGK